MANEQARVAVQLTLQGASGFVRGLTRVSGGFSTIRSNISQAAADAFHFIQVGKDVYNLTRRMAAGSVSLANALLDPNEQFETAALQFETLLGSAAAAKERIEALYEYANKTPFLNPDVLQGGKILQAFGKDALGTGKGLEMTGDMAAYAGAQFNEIAIWVGRAYSSIMGGRPFGEAAQRLQELTLLTGEERNRLEALNESGASAATIWAAFTDIMTKTEGSAQRLSDSMRGAKSTIAGLWGEIKRLTGIKLFESVKEDIIGIRDDLSDAFDTERIQDFADKAGTAIAGFYDTIKNKALGGLTVEDIFSAAEQDKLGELVSTILKGAGHNFGVAVYNAALQYGPSIQRMLIPERLHGILGIKTSEQLGVVEAMAGGTATKEQLRNLSFMDKASLSLAGVLGGFAPLEEMGPIWAQQKQHGKQPAPYWNMSDLIGGVGIQQPAPAWTPESMNRQIEEQFEERVRSVSDTLKMLERTANDAASALVGIKEGAEF